MIEIAKNAAFAAAQVLLDNFGKISRSDIREKSKNDFLTFVDEKSEHTIMDILHGAFPNHDILAEETGGKKQESAYKWIIDPLDGTKNYIRGIPIFGISIALMHNNEIILGVVLDPIHNELFTAEKDKGAFLNGTVIRVSSNDRLETCLLATGFPFKNKQFLQAYSSSFKDIFNSSSGVRRMGAACIDLAHLACGRFDGFWELGLSPWDVAAGTLIIKEAGGSVSDFWGKADYLYKKYYVASNGLIHNRILKILHHHFPRYVKIE
jgi:myo-inositol-1(or 4)-monophosphatase